MKTKTTTTAEGTVLNYAGVGNLKGAVNNYMDGTINHHILDQQANEGFTVALQALVDKQVEIYDADNKNSNSVPMSIEIKEMLDLGEFI